MHKDVLAVMYELDKNKIETSFVAVNVSRIPRCDPKDVDPYANLQLILDLQDRVQQIEDNVGSVHAQVITNKENIEKNYKTLGQVGQTVIKIISKDPASFDIFNGDSDQESEREDGDDEEGSDNPVSRSYATALTQVIPNISGTGSQPL